MVALSALGMPATADPSTLAGVALRSSFPSWTSWRMTTAQNVLVMLPMPNNMSGRIGAPDWRSAFAGDPRPDYSVAGCDCCRDARDAMCDCGIKQQL